MHWLYKTLIPGYNIAVGAQNINIAYQKKKLTGDTYCEVLKEAGFSAILGLAEIGTLGMAYFIGSHGTATHEIEPELVFPVLILKAGGGALAHLKNRIERRNLDAVIEQELKKIKLPRIYAL